MISLALCLLGWGAIITPGAADTGIPSVPSYARSIHTLRVSMDQQVGPAAPNEIAHLQRQLRSLDRIRLPDGRVLRTDMTRLAGELQAGDVLSLRRVAGQLDALDAGLRTLPRRKANVQQLRQLDLVLRDARFHPPRSWVQQLEDWLGSLLARIDIGRLPFLSLPPWLVAGLFLVLLVGTAFYLARRTLRRVAVDVAPEVVAGGTIDAQRAEEQATQRAAVGDYRNALRFLFLAAMLALQEHGVLELRPGLTNREYLQLLQSAAPRQELRPALEELIDWFDASWYGHLRFDAAAYARCQALAQQILTAARQEAAA